MADNLTVKSGSTAPRSGESKGADDAKAREQAELNRLRGIAKKHHGRELNDKTLKAIVARRKAKIAKQQALDEKKEDFQTNQSREKVAGKTDRQVQTQKAMGTKEARGPSKDLPAKDAKQVRTNAESGPKLPPNLAKSTTPEQAARVLDKMFSFITVDGEAFDQKAYAETLREKPPTQVKEEATTKSKTGSQPGGKQTAANPSGRQTGQQPQQAQQAQQPRQTAKPGDPKGKTPQGKTSGKTAGKTTAGKAQPTRAQPGKAPIPGKLGQTSGGLSSTNQGSPTSQPGARGPGQMPSPGALPGRGPTAMPTEGTGTGPALAMSTRGASASMRASSVANPSSLSGGTGVSSDGLFNAGGGLITNSKFDGLNFNWDAFNWFFTMVVMKDLHKYRKEMKELRRQEGKAAIAGMRLRHAIKKMRQIFDRNKAVADFFEEVKDAVGKIKGEVMKQKANEALGDIEHQEVQNRRERADLNQQKKGLEQQIGKLTEEMQGLAPDSVEYQQTAEKVATAREQLQGVEGQLTENAEAAEALQEQRESMERERDTSEGQIGKLADLYQQRRDGEISEEDFQRNLAQYRDTLAGLQGHQEVGPYMNQRGNELSESMRYHLQDRQRFIQQARTARGNIRDLRTQLQTEGREATAEEQQQLQTWNEQVEEAREGLQQIRHIGDKALLHEATMMSLTSLDDRQAALQSADDRITLATQRLQALDNNEAPQLLKDFDPPLSSDPTATEDKAFWQRQLQDMQDARPILQWGVDHPEISNADITRRSEDDPGLLQLLEARSPMSDTGDRHHDRRRPGRNGMRVAGDLLRTQRQDRGLWGKVADISMGAGKFLDTIEDGTQSAIQAAEQAVDRTIDTSINIDLQARHEANAMMRRHASRAQGMVNQLMQLLRMQRSG